VAFTSAWTKGCFQSENIRIIPVDNTDNSQELLWLKLASEPLSPIEQRFLSEVYESLGKPIPEYLNSEFPGCPDNDTVEK